MQCKCHKLENASYLDEAPIGFQRFLDQIDMGDWMRLYQCKKCNALWAIDEWDKYYPQVVVRINERDRWKSEVTEDIRKSLLAASRGGVVEGECIWAGCHKPPIHGVVYCIDHLYDTGARK